MCHGIFAEKFMHACMDGYIIYLFAHVHEKPNIWNVNEWNNLIWKNPLTKLSLFFVVVDVFFSIYSISRLSCVS